MFPICTPALSDGPAQFLKDSEWRTMQAIGACWNDDIIGNRKTVLDIYTPLARRADKSDVQVTRDIAYGVNARQVIDLFVPVGARGAPVVVFVHGGAFTRGTRSVNGEIYDNVLYWFAKQGYVGVNVEYRLASDARYPSGAEDVAAACSWISDHAESCGGDPDRIVVIGHSAGGAHLATFLLGDHQGPKPKAGIKAAVFLSARLRFDIRPDNPNARNVAAYCGTDELTLDRDSPLKFARNCRWPVFVGFAEYENRYLDTYSLEFAHAIAQAQGRSPRVVQIAGHNHTSIVAHFNTGEDRLGQEIVAFMEGALAR